MNKFKLAVSFQNGSNLQALIDASKSSDCPFKIELVFSNNPNAYGLARASQETIFQL